MGNRLYQSRLANGKNGDPALWTLIARSGEAVLFDLGSIDALSNREVLKAAVVCVSHCHIDHFIGFDRLLRVNIPHFRIIRLVGPPGIQEHVAGKLRGYLWNLLEPDQIRFEIYEVTDSGVNTYNLTSSTGFAIEIIGNSRERDSSGAGFPVLTLQDDSQISACVLDHGTPCLAFRLDGPKGIYVDSEALRTEGIAPGRWIAEAQSHFCSGRTELSVRVNGQMLRVAELAERYFRQGAGYRLAYATDIAFSYENLRSFRTFFLDSDSLWIDASFREEHSDRARNTKHLTTRQAALMAASARVRSFSPFHFSSIYGDDLDGVEQEAERYYEEYTSLGTEQLDGEIVAEFGRCWPTLDA